MNICEIPEQTDGQAFRYNPETLGTSVAWVRLYLSHYGAFVTKDRIVAVGLLTQHDLNLLGHSFTRLWPVEDTPCFSQLLRAIDEADREISRQKDALANSSRVES